MEVVGLLERKEEGKGASDEVARFLYPAKAAAGPCTHLTRCGGRSFLMQACRLVVYFLIIFIKNIFNLKIKIN